MQLIVYRTWPKQNTVERLVEQVRFESGINDRVMDNKIGLG